MTQEKQRVRAIAGWRQVNRRPGILPRPAFYGARLPNTPQPATLEARLAQSNSAANERADDKTGGKE